MRYVVALLPILLLRTCDSGTSAPDYGKVTVAFAISDTLGKPASSFHSGEDFDMSFSVHNGSGGTLSYFYTGVPVILEIFAADTLVATSVDGYIFTQVIRNGTLPDGGSYSITWRAPSTKARVNHLVLQPGAYEARVSHGSFFSEFTLTQTPAVPFTVTE